VRDQHRRALKRTTYQAYECHIRVHFKPAFGPLALQALHRDTIQGYLASKLAGGAKAKSVARCGCGAH
jgi:hypothetical protein